MQKKSNCIDIKFDIEKYQALVSAQLENSKNTMPDEDNKHIGHVLLMDSIIEARTAGYYILKSNSR